MKVKQLLKVIWINENQCIWIYDGGRHRKTIKNSDNIEKIKELLDRKVKYLEFLNDGIIKVMI